MWQTLGQDHVINFLRDSIQRGTLAHAYLLAGPAHVGKMRLALDLAKTLNCTGSQPPCGNCPACQRIEQGKFSDVVIIDKNAGRDPKERKKATEIGIDTIRELLQHGSNLPPYEGKFKVFIVDDAELMSTEAANCLLKTLEEPPKYIVLILLSSKDNLLLPTVISRCQRFELKPLAISEIEARMAHNPDVPPEKARLLARLSNGCLGWALTAMGDNNYFNQRDARLSEFAALITQTWDERFNYAQQLPSDRSSVEELVRLWLLWSRDVMLVKYNCDDQVTNLDRLKELKSWANMMTVVEITGLIECLNKALVDLGYNANIHLLFEVIMLDIPRKDKRADFAYSPASTA